MATNETVTKILREGPQPARALYERLGISQPTLSRLTNQLGESILRFGKARQTQYALRRKLGSHITFPLYRVSASGDLEQWGLLHPIMPEGYLVETWATQLNEARTEIHPGLPWYLQDMRPQGFLGRSFARFHGPMLGLPVDPNRWSDDQALLALANTGHDTPGNLMVGEESASHFQTNALFSKLDGAFQPVPAEQRLQAYPEFARLALLYYLERFQGDLAAQGFQVTPLSKPLDVSPSGSIADKREAIGGGPGFSLKISRRPPVESDGNKRPAP